VSSCLHRSYLLSSLVSGLEELEIEILKSNYFASQFFELKTRSPLDVRNKLAGSSTAWRKAPKQTPKIRSTGDVC
jgi:hypothetical protein